MSMTQAAEGEGHVHWVTARAARFANLMAFLKGLHGTYPNDLGELSGWLEMARLPGSLAFFKRVRLQTLSMDLTIWKRAMAASEGDRNGQ